MSVQQPQNARQPQRGIADFQQLVARAKFLRENPEQQKNPNEYDTIVKFIQGMSQQHQQNRQPPAPSSVQANGSASITSGPIQPYAQTQTPITFSQSQVDTLRQQIAVFKLVARGAPIPEHYRQSIHLPNTVIPDLQKLVQGPTDIHPKIVDNVVKIQKSEELPVDSADIPKGPFLEDDVDSGIYPYNAYRHPLTLLKRPENADPVLFATRSQRLLIPSIMPAGLDAHHILEERDRFIEARMQQRIRELENLPSTTGEGNLETPLDDTSIGLFEPSPHAPGKLRAMIELKSLKLLEKQRNLRTLVSERLMHGSLLPLNRADFRRVRKPTVRDARNTEQLERKQRQQRELRAKTKHVEQLEVICKHGQELIAVNRAAHDRVARLGRAVLSFHAHTEKEEQKRIERISKERLRALKADDEEAYLKLIDTAKDTRITHLIRQTDTYLEGLAQAVVAQQNESGPASSFEENMQFDVEEGPASEATFGAQIAADDVVPDNSGKVDYYAVAHRISEKVTRQPSILVGGTLKEYQIKGLQWMVSLYNNRLNGILADEMGLGKTIQTISLITFLIESKRQVGPYLVIVPLSTMTNWSGEFAKWAPTVKMIAYKGNPAQRRALQNELRPGHFQVLLTTYEYIIKDRPQLSKFKWVHMIIDEGHRMKNTQSKLSQTLSAYYHSRYRLILTGTPLQNNLPELWALLNAVLPKIFNSVKSFDEWFNTPFANSGTGDKIELNEEEQLLIIRRLHKVLRPFLLRRLKKDVEKDLPDKMEKVIKIRMSALQSQLYKQMKKHKMIADGSEKQGKTGGVKGLSNELMQLRKICQHPYLFESVEDKISPTGLIDDKIVRTSGKIELLSRVLPKFFSTGHRVLIFFQMTKVMDIMEDFLKMMQWKYLRLDGGTKTDDRADYVRLFNAKDSEYNVFILSTRAGGLGLNLQTADTVIIFDSDWNPHADLQAQDRAHRIGQTKAVLILRFITEKSVEEAMYARARYKLDIDDKVIQAGRFDNKSTQEEQEEFLRSILEADQEEEENEEAGDLNDEELNMLIARSEDEVEVYRQQDIKRERDAQEAWHAHGHRGKPPPPLMQLDELPECYQTDEPFTTVEVDETTEGRGQRKRNAVSYNDGLSDDAWALAVDDGEDLEELAERARERKDRRSLIKDEPSARGTPISDTEVKPKKGRKGKGKMNAPDYEPPPPSGKRKRNVKEVSVTPSANGDDEDERETKRRKTKSGDPPLAVREKMKKAFAECYRAVLACEDHTGRRRCELFKDLPDRRIYADYYELIANPIALTLLRKRSGSNYYKNVQAYRDDWRLMFNNARTYNQEGSWVYVDAEEMEKVFDAAWNRVIVGSGLPGAPPANNGASYASGSSSQRGSAMVEDERPAPARRQNSARKQVIQSDEEYLTPSDEE